MCVCFTVVYSYAVRIYCAYAGVAAAATTAVVVVVVAVLLLSQQPVRSRYIATDAVTAVYSLWFLCTSVYWCGACVSFFFSFIVSYHNIDLDIFGVFFGREREST